jgi:hypothetical protein
MSGNSDVLSQEQVKALEYYVGGFDVLMDIAMGKRFAVDGPGSEPDFEVMKPNPRLALECSDELSPTLICSLTYNLRGYKMAHAVATGQKLVRIPGRVLVNCRNLDPMVHIGKSGWALIPEKTDYNAANLKTVNFHESVVEFQHCIELADDTGFITGFQKYEYLKKSGHVLLGTGALLALWYEKGQETLKWLYSRGLLELEFFGDILKSPMDNECVPTLRCDDRGIWTIVAKKLELPFGRKMYAAVIKRGNQ